MQFSQENYMGVNYTKNSKSLHVYLIEATRLPAERQTLMVRSKQLAREIAGELASREYQVSIKTYSVLEGEPS